MSTDLPALVICLWVWMKGEFDTPDELSARILGIAGFIAEREDQLRRTTRDLCTQVAKCSEVAGRIL